MFGNFRKKQQNRAAPASAWKEALGNLPAVVEKVGQQKTTMSAQLVGLGSLSITAGDLVDGNWNKVIRSDCITENSMRKEVTAQYLAAIGSATTAQHGRMIGGLMANNTSKSFGSEDFFARINATREAAGIYRQPEDHEYQQYSMPIPSVSRGRVVEVVPGNRVPENVKGINVFDHQTFSDSEESEEEDQQVSKRTQGERGSAPSPRGEKSPKSEGQLSRRRKRNPPSLPAEASEL